MPFHRSAPIASAPWDVIIIGGGPAGSTAATVLSRAGRKVLVLEKSRFPRFHVGESLLPYNRALFETLGVWPKIEAAGFTIKRGAQFIMGNGSHRTRLDFSKGRFTEFPSSIQVDRATFDQLLLEHSREMGATVQEEALVLEHHVEADAVRVKYRASDGSTQEAQAAFLMDASGLANFTANRSSLRNFYPNHRKIAIFGHFQNVEMPRGPEEGDILIIRRNNSWFWMIPLRAGLTSVGFVLDRGSFQQSGGSPEEQFHRAVQETREVRDRFELASMSGKLHVANDFSYQNRSFVSERIVRVGDAAGFIDPIFSSGVLLAMTSAHEGAQAVQDALSSGKSLTRRMKRFERENRRKIGIYWEFIERFYRDRFAQLFFQPYNRFGIVCAVQSVLAGRTRFPLALRLRLRAFFLIARLNEWFPVAPRIRVE